MKTKTKFLKEAEKVEAQIQELIEYISLQKQYAEEAEESDIQNLLELRAKINDFMNKGA